MTAFYAGLLLGAALATAVCALLKPEWAPARMISEDTA